MEELEASLPPPPASSIPALFIALLKQSLIGQLPGDETHKTVKITKEKIEAF